MNGKIEKTVGICEICKTVFYESTPIPEIEKHFYHKKRSSV